MPDDGKADKRRVDTGMKHARKHHEKPHAEHHQHSEHISVRIDDLAIPEIHTGHVNHPEKLECEACPVYYDCVAVPEIHFRDALQCPAEVPIDKANT